MWFHNADKTYLKSAGQVSPGTHQRPVYHWHDQGREHIPYPEFLSEGKIDTDTKDQCRPDKAQLADQGITDKGAAESRNQCDASLIDKEGNCRKNGADPAGRSKDHRHDEVENRLRHQHGIIPADPVLYGLNFAYRR